MKLPRCYHFYRSLVVITFVASLFSLILLPPYFLVIIVLTFSILPSLPYFIVFTFLLLSSLPRFHYSDRPHIFTTLISLLFLLFLSPTCFLVLIVLSPLLSSPLSLLCSHCPCCFFTFIALIAPLLYYPIALIIFIAHLFSSPLLLFLLSSPLLLFYSHHPYRYFILITFITILFSSPLSLLYSQSPLIAPLFSLPLLLFCSHRPYCYFIFIAPLIFIALISSSFSFLIIPN